ncbi:hypothetical protein G5B40_19875 [Pikeienuella piscinae]|uniref:Guanylate cyclase domain-containing protein n=1 Tax=Pikeienuella piscinae TaxID=2748098 RepID=A0A7M3T674_9RHOB|nr:adenylate/guanylate cyclase domain-containing protein [Pikeienuella piscinae]QIE57505.1 hypothetical protein G5B40_19875 [Pikeienuella piscinae]
MDRSDAVARIRALAVEGELLAAVDLARAAAPEAADEGERRAIRTEEVIVLARMASLEEAREKYEEYGLATGDGLARSLRARLLKDVGFEAEDEGASARLMRESRDLYLDITFGHDPDGPAPNREQYEYNAINAITLSRLIGDMGPVAEPVERLGRGRPEDTYWSWATRAEYLLATGAPATAVGDALGEAVARPGAGVGPRATTLRQLTRIAPDHPALDILRPGPALHHAGHMIAPKGARHGRILASNEAELTRRIGEKLTEIGPSAVFGSLASGADVIVTEWALANGRDAHVYLPFAKKAFFAASIRPAGAAWEERARACLRHPRCRLIELTAEQPVPGDDHAFNAVSRFAMGAAILRAERAFGPAEQLLVWDGTPATGPAGAAADGEMWRRTGRAQHIVNVSDLGTRPPAPPSRDAASPNRAARALVFGDVKNFSKLNEARLPEFVAVVMGAVRAALDDAAARAGAAVFVNTWGDGVFAVFNTAAAAAVFALALQDRMRALDLAGHGLPPDLAIRLGLHFGMVYPLAEPVTGADNYFGEAVARAARIEPITRAGRIFVTEEFAAELALDRESPAHPEYVGEVDAAKKYGRFRLYRIRWRRGAG